MLLLSLPHDDDHQTLNALLLLLRVTCIALSRRERNRIAARKCRQRRVNAMRDLELQERAGVEEREQLRAELSYLEGQCCRQRLTVERFKRFMAAFWSVEDLPAAIAAVAAATAVSDSAAGHHSGGGGGSAEAAAAETAAAQSREFGRESADTAAGACSSNSRAAEFASDAAAADAATSGTAAAAAVATTSPSAAADATAFAAPSVLELLEAIELELEKCSDEQIHALMLAEQNQQQQQQRV